MEAFARGYKKVHNAYLPRYIGSELQKKILPIHDFIYIYRIINCIDPFFEFDNSELEKKFVKRKRLPYFFELDSAKVRLQKILTAILIHYHFLLPLLPTIHRYALGPVTPTPICSSSDPNCLYTYPTD